MWPLTTRTIEKESFWLIQFVSALFRCILVRYQLHRKGLGSAYCATLPFLFPVCIICTSHHLPRYSRILPIGITRIDTNKRNNKDFMETVYCELYEERHHVTRSYSEHVVLLLSFAISDFCPILPRSWQMEDYISEKQEYHYNIHTITSFQ